MARDKTKDDKFFNCSEEHEFEYVSGLSCQEIKRQLKAA